MGGAASTLLQHTNPDVLLPPIDGGGVGEEFSTIFSEKIYKNHIAFVLEEKKGTPSASLIEEIKTAVSRQMAMPSISQVRFMRRGGSRQ